MTPLALGLVVLAAFSHPPWNAVRIAPVSYVPPAREISIVFGTLLGIALHGERHPAPRLAGAALILVGVLVLGAAGA